MSGRTDFENSLVNAVEGIRDAYPAWTESIKFLGAGSGLGDFGDGWSATFKSPIGYVGKVVGCSIFEITETFACDTTEARVDVGITGDTDKFYVGDGITDGAAAATPENGAGTTKAEMIPSNTDILVTGNAGVDTGTEAGIASVNLVIEWYTE